MFFLSKIKDGVSVAVSPGAQDVLLMREPRFNSEANFLFLHIVHFSLSLLALSALDLSLSLSLSLSLCILFVSFIPSLFLSPLSLSLFFKVTQEDLFSS